MKRKWRVKEKGADALDQKGFLGKNAFQRKIRVLLEVERFKFSVADAVNLSIKFGKLEKL